MQLVVVTAVSAAVRAATITFATTSQKRLLITLLNYRLKMKLTLSFLLILPKFFTLPAGAARLCRFHQGFVRPTERTSVRTFRSSLREFASLRSF